MTPAERLAEINSLPEDVRDLAVCDWSLVKVLIGAPNERRARINVQNKGIQLVAINGRKKLPRFGALKSMLQPQEPAAA